MDLYNCKIMLVDDESALRRMVEEFLAREGFWRVKGAGSCKEAREIFGEEHPDLILLDVMLPDEIGRAHV